jgi:hypothetical protein
LNHTVILYDKEAILQELNMNNTDFREIMVLSGTDYNIDSNTNLYETLKWKNQYDKYLVNCHANNIIPNTFYVWLYKNTKYIADFKKLLTTYQLFHFGEDELKNIGEDCFVEKPINIDQVKTIMKIEGFLFPETTRR